MDSSVDDEQLPPMLVLPDIEVLKSAFKRAACYSLTLTVIVAIIGELLSGIYHILEPDIMSRQFRCRCFSLTMCSVKRFTHFGWLLLCEHIMTVPYSSYLTGWTKYMGAPQWGILYYIAGMGIEVRDYAYCNGMCSVC